MYQPHIITQCRQTAWRRLPYLTAYRMHCHIRLTPISAGQIQEKKSFGVFKHIVLETLLSEFFSFISHVFMSTSSSGQCGARQRRLWLPFFALFSCCSCCRQTRIIFSAGGDPKALASALFPFSLAYSTTLN